MRVKERMEEWTVAKVSKNRKKGLRGARDVDWVLLLHNSHR